MRVLGIDLGIASCGWAVVKPLGDAPHIVAAGARCFDAPLIDKTKEPKSAVRRAKRGQRRVIRRRQQRMQSVRAILHNAGLLHSADSHALRDALRRAQQQAGGRDLTPWQLRSAVHDRLLSDDELSVVLGHIARHRGFRSNSKRDAGANAPDETSKMKKAMELTRESLAKYRTFGEMVASDEKFADRKRNRDKDYSHTPKRSDLEDELRAIFKTQRRFGQMRANEALEEKIAHAAFWQRPLQDSDKMVGDCIFEVGEKRTARFAPSFEMFRYLQRLVNLSVTVGRSDRKLSVEELALATRDFGKSKGITFKALRNLLDLDANARFAGISLENEKLDVAARNGAAAAGTRAIRQALGESPWLALMRTPDRLDQIAEILTFREDLVSIRVGLSTIGLETLVVDQLAKAADDGAFTEFRGAAHISAKAARNIIPGLREGLVYSDACERVGYDHAARPAVSLDQINSPVARRAFSEAIKQIRTVAHEFGPIDFVHIELARDVGKSAEEREKLTKGIDDRNKIKDKRRMLAAERAGREISNDELMRFELATEQHFKCIYCDSAIAPDGFRANDTRYQVDHILPWSRFGDDSFTNKTLCCVGCNQEKKGRTPFEWFSADKGIAQWDKFVACFENLKDMKGFKKRNFKLKDAASVEDKFKARNLTDTRWACRLLADELTRLFPAPEGKRRIFTRPGAITSKLRRAWGLETLKKIDGQRVPDDRHHAVDAIVLATTTEGLLQAMTKDIQKREREGRSDDIFHVAQPWRHFREDIISFVYGENGIGGVFVSRAEQRRARGEAHKATVKQIREIDGVEKVYERRAVQNLTEKDLELIPTPEPYGKVTDPAKLRDELVEALRIWIKAGKPKGDNLQPRSPKGDIVRKVRVRTDAKVGVRLHGGTVDRGDMARVDVFRKADKNGKFKFYLVPIYPHEIATIAMPPDRAVLAHKPESEWPIMDTSYEFLWSIHQKTWLSATKSNGEIVEGYFRGLDRASGNIAVSAHENSDNIVRGLGVKTLAAFSKFAIDRLGRKSSVLAETRTWRGAACT